MDAEHPLRLAVVAGARPNFMKVSPILAEIDRRVDIEALLVHSGQHYDHAMSQAFFDDLTMPEPDAYLGVGSGAHGEQTAKVMLAFEPWLMTNAVDAVVVVGDVNSTVACALVAAKLGVPLVHVEAGLRSFDRTMPEEINRIVTDRLSGLLLTPSADADENLRAEGVDPADIRLVGNVMIDALVRFRARAEESDVGAALGLDGEFVLVTLHRPSNVDDPATLAGIMDALSTIASERTVVFPVHPRTRERLDGIELPGIRLLDPLGYVEFLALESRASLVLTDSGGVQEETTFLDVPCLTLRPNTERPVTTTMGTNRVIGSDPSDILEAAGDAFSGSRPHAEAIPMWDGEAAGRIVDALVESYG